MLKQIIVILGPTASGKTGLSIKLAKDLNGEIVSADSRQIYNGMDIGTGKVTSDERQRIPHGLIDVTTPDNPWSLPQWQQAAFTAIDKTFAQGAQPILAGGTMQYIDSVIQNWSIPEVPENKTLREKLNLEKTDKLAQALFSQDAEAKNFVEAHNKRRIIRALEVIEETGKPFSESRAKNKPKYDFTIIGLFPGWDELEKRITARVKKMLSDGLINETKMLQQKHGDELLQNTVNYKQALAVINKEMNLAEAEETMIRANLRYARRQMSWLRPSQPRKKRGEVGWKTGDIAHWFANAENAIKVFSSQA